MGKIGKNSDKDIEINENIEKTIILDFINELILSLEYIKANDRAQKIRPQIIQYLMSSFMTDDERATYFGLPEGCRMRENSKIISPENLYCGRYVWIGEGAILDASGGLEIGEHTSIGLYVLVWSHSSYLANVTLNNKIGNELITRRPTRIGKGCFIAGHSVIYPGVNIGDKTVVLPMSVVTSDIPGNCIVGGVPANKIKDLTEEDILFQKKRVMER